MKAIVILPCCNEQDSVGKVIDSLRKTAKEIKLDLKIIAIDDASKDNTLDVLKKKKINTLIGLDKKISLAGLIRIGLKVLNKHKADYVIHIDSDGQYDASELPQLIKAIKHHGMVIGNRQYVKLKHMPLIKKFGNLFFSAIVSTIIGQRIEDSQSGFRLLTYDVAKKLKLKSKYTYTQEEIIQVKKLNYKIKQVPITFRKRKYGKSKLIKNPFEYGYKVMLDILSFK